MEKNKFHFIELPKPEITISAAGTSHILGGTICEIQYDQCVGNKSTTCSLDSHGNGYDKNSNCPGSTGTSYCATYNLTCTKYPI